jgi:hypothetical protein
MIRHARRMPGMTEKFVPFDPAGDGRWSSPAFRFDPTRKSQVTVTELKSVTSFLRLLTNVDGC